MTDERRAPEAARRVRRGLLAGGLAGVVAAILGRPSRAEASHRGRQFVAVDEQTVGHGTTELVQQPDPQAKGTAAPAKGTAAPAFVVRTRAGAAVLGFSGDPMAHFDAATDEGVALGGWGQEQGGIFVAGGEVEGDLLRFPRAALRGVTADPEKVGVVAAHAGGGTALDVMGKARFMTDKRAIFPARQRASFVRDPNVTARSHILADFIEDSENSSIRWIQHVQDGFVVHLDHALDSPKAFRYLVVEGEPL